MNHGYVGAEHLLLGLMREQMGMAGIILRSLGINQGALSDQLTRQFPPNAKEFNVSSPDLSPGCKRAINRGVFEAQRANHPLVSTEHLLLGLISQPEGSAARLLQRLGCSPTQVEERILQLLNNGNRDAVAPSIRKRKAEFEERYKIESVIGVGSMGTVYRARDLNYANVVRFVALKEMTVELDDIKLRAEVVSNFQQEAGILASLKHPFIPRFYEFFNVGDRYYIVMEYIVGQDLETILGDTNEHLPVLQVLDWGIQLCDVLAYLHNHPRQPIIFRDMKPSNVMIDNYGNVRLIDFNIARLFAGGVRRTSAGTQGYCPPEQYHGEVTPKVDIYALGATLHHLLTKLDPRTQPAFSFDQRPIRTYNPGVSIALEVVIHRALSYHLDQRYHTIEDMRAALLAVRREKG
jgi:tRNA A-37 threonylcarbamoyl transferase component Bud32